ncbi:unnamed protein product [Ceutorhynchus assimilis]|uniref:Alpha-1,3-glucosyltransferase n=1 Tax=Ceutorhynchus assimilis TaxID=467358 RepID=A0A9N9MK63_9CUCU|nr:unnamed protein product [Ceutorhynchus assimilis]
MIIATTLLTSCAKLLLIPAYRSTDFEVHRNWLAITHSLPIKKWYYEDTSEWTLDYPPFFAWFECFLSYFATLFDKNMLVVDNLNYSSEKTVLFQRLSVILTDLVYAYGVHRVSEALPKSWKKDVVLPILLLTNCGLIMVDHIHFQYNGIMYGIMLISIAFMLKEQFNLAAFWFAVLLNMKHIYVYLAPAYFIYLLRHCCFNGETSLKAKTFIGNFLQLGGIVIGIFAVSFLPFANDIPQVLSRLFPFKRGLSHAYWAPNVWAVYNTFDKVAAIFKGNSNSAAMTGGLVQEFSHTVLPSVSPLMTMLLTVLFMMPAIVKLWFLNKSGLHFLRCLVLCGLTSFLFGWHVHEKAILMAIIPMSILSIMEPTEAKLFLILSTIGHYSLFPLLYPQSLIFTKTLFLILYSIYSFYSLYKINQTKATCKYTLPLLNIFESLLVLGLVAVFAYEQIIHKLLGFDKKWPFLPLMLTSFYCALGIMYCWGKYYVYFLRMEHLFVGKTKKKNK